MRALDAFLAVALASPTAWAQQSPPAESFIPDTYIVELEPEADFVGASDHFSRKRADFGYTTRQEFNNRDLFYGISLKITDGSDASRIEAIPGVKNVWKTGYVPRPGPVNPVPSPSTDDFFSPMAAEPAIPHITGDSDVNRPLTMGGVDKLHEKGIKGKDMKIAIVDTGVDYMHPSFGGGFGPGYKIAFGTDYVGDDYDGLYNDPVPDNDPRVTCANGGHGTHVSGIIGMSDGPGIGFGLTGVAPEATLGMYRVFGCSGGTTDDILITAILAAAEENVDVISISVGDGKRWESHSAYTTLAKRLLDNGIAIIVSAGNSGTAGPYSTGDPGLSPSIFAVGSIENEVIPTTYHAHDNENRIIEYYQVFPVDGEYTIFALGSGVEDDDPELTPSNGCDDRAWDVAFDSITDHEHTIIMVMRDNICYPWQIEQKLARFNVTKLIYYPATPDMDLFVEYPETDPLYLTTTYQTGQDLLADVSKRWPQVDYILKFDDQAVHDSSTALGGLMNSFSSYGPTIEGSVKPDISAPGGNILSTWPLVGGGYCTLSGTSMSAPFTSASYALIKSQRPDLSAAEILDIMRSTAEPLRASHQSSDLVVAAVQQGSGMVNAFKAMHAETMVQPSKLSLYEENPARRNFTVQNIGASAKTYTISHRPASHVNLICQFQTINTPIPDLWVHRFQSNNAPNYGDAEFSETTFTLQPGESREVDVKIIPPGDVVPVRQPVYSGFVEISTDDDSYSVPYAGIPYNRYDVGPIAINTSVYYDDGQDLPRMRPSTKDEGKPNLDEYTLDANSELGAPTAEFLISQPFRFIRVDVVPADTAFEPTLYSFDPSVHIDYKPPANLTVHPGFLDVPTYGVYIQFAQAGERPPAVEPVDDFHDISFYSTPLTWLGNLVVDEKGTTVKATPGDYRFLLRVLRFGGNNTEADDYMSWLGPVIRIVES